MGTTATSTPAELDSTGEIDVAWVESVLADSYPGVAVRSVAKAPIGAGNVSDTVKVTIEYANRPEGAPDAVVAKFRPSAPEVHAHGLGSGAYHREVGAYRVIGERAACRIPHAYHVAGDETNINLVLEDLSSAVPGDQIAGCTPVEAEAVLTELAKLQARFSPLEDATVPCAADPDGGRLRLLGRGNPDRSRRSAPALSGTHARPRTWRGRRRRGQPRPRLVSVAAVPAHAHPRRCAGRQRHVRAARRSHRRGDSQLAGHRPAQSHARTSGTSCPAACRSPTDASTSGASSTSTCGSTPRCRRATARTRCSPTIGSSS